jgi:hypothetical protein
MKKTTILLSMCCGATLALTANAQQQYVFPKLGQTPEQQQKDEYDCYQWAARQTNFDPMAAGLQTPPPPSSGSAQAAPGSGLKGAAVGAATGAAIGAIAGDAGKGAAIGAVAGGVGGRLRSRRQAEDAQKQQQAQAQAAAAQTAQRQQEYLKAKAACLEAKGYSVK